MTTQNSRQFYDLPAPEGDCPTCDGIATHVGDCATENLANDLYGAGFFIVALDVNHGRRDKPWALEHVRHRAGYWPGAQAVLDQWETGR